ncbi:MAG: fused MFS/spermidine synthase [Solirubrobacteraceae bacterium]|nr:fused MFS/spermidine synthase [Solirubrobacteraceae bacterium]
MAVAGLSTLGSEIAAARLLAPAFGSSTVIWANTIAIVLVALAVGAWLGGRLADRGPTPHNMYRLLLGGAGLLALTPILAVPLLGVGVEALDEVNAPGFLGSLLAVLILVATPLSLLGAVSPYAVRLALGDVERGGGDAVARAGSLAGRLSALATAGSLVGTFLAALALIPLLGTRRTFLLFALLLAIVAVWGLAAAPTTSAAAQADVGASGSRRSVLLASLVPLAIALLMIAPTPTVKAASFGLTLLEERETNEQYARVLQTAEGMRMMELGEGNAVHSLRRPGTVLTGEYWDELLVLPHLAGRAPEKVMILGNAGGTTATALRALDPDVHVDAVDYDAQLAELGTKWFGLGGPRLRVLTGDARVELRRSDGDYDAIIVDAYRQPYIPFHLSTREFFSLAKDRLAPGGVVIVNVGHPEGDRELERVLGASMQAAGLRYVVRDPAQRLSTQVAARAEPIELETMLRSFQSRRSQLAALPGAAAESRSLAADRAALDQTAIQTAARLEPGFTDGAVYTDDKAPVELLVDGSLAKVALGGE